MHRHCERSEAIHLAAQRKNGLLRCARNDVEKPVPGTTIGGISTSSWFAITGDMAVYRSSPYRSLRRPIWITPPPCASVLSNRLKSRCMEGEQREIQGIRCAFNRDRRCRAVICRSACVRSAKKHYGLVRQGLLQV